uniref:Immunoglobulin domain-containing protein n=1 Tax=Cyprinus carpio TaxID=7962 RepID=A0A8C1Y966_CYPCA
MLWVFGDKDILLAKLDAETKEISLYDAEERFRGRLQLDPQTGSLTITDTSTTDAGLYQLQIRGRGSMQQFILTVNRGLSAGAVAGIVIAVLAAVLAAVAAVVIYHRRKISELQKQTLPLTVSEGEDITLKLNNKINKGDEMKWMFGEGKQLNIIAEIRGETGKIFTYNYAADGRFRGRLDLDKTTGSLTIRNSRAAHSGPYTLQIKSRSGTSVHIFFVTVNEKVTVESVKEGDPVTLKPDPEIQRDEQMLWMFGEQDDLIAQVKAGAGEMYDGGAGEIFRGRLELDEKTGSLSITDISAGHTGLYKLLTISSRGILIKKFRVFLQMSTVIMTVGEPVHLSTDHPKIERDDEIEWRFGSENFLIAEIRGGSVKTYDGPDGRFRGRLELNDQTGDLIILDSAAKHTGCYNLKIRNSKGDTIKINIVVRERRESWNGENLLFALNIFNFTTIS